MPRLTSPDLIAPDPGAAAYHRMLDIAALVDPACAGMDPIDGFEIMADAASRIACAPLIHGDVSDAVPGFRPRTLGFADIAVLGVAGPVGSALGGTGIAVSAFSAAPQQAIDFACWVASADVQRGVHAQSGGPPGHAAAWQEVAVNAATGSFYAAARATLQRAWVGPRHDGYMTFQAAAAERITDAVVRREAAKTVIADINRLFRNSFRAGQNSIHATMR